jgi:hypothetical protein
LTFFFDDLLVSSKLLPAMRSKLGACNSNKKAALLLLDVGKPGQTTP